MKFIGHLLILVAHVSTGHRGQGSIWSKNGIGLLCQNLVCDEAHIQFFSLALSVFRITKV